MKKWKNLRTLTVILFSIHLASCASVRLLDAEWCADIGPAGASCFHTYTAQERDISKETWDALSIGPDHRFGKVCTDPENFGDLKAALQKLCRRARCTYETRQAIENFFNGIASLQTKASIQ